MSNMFAQNIGRLIAGVIVVAIVGFSPHTGFISNSVAAHAESNASQLSVAVDPSSLLVEYDISGSALNIVASAPNNVWFTLPAESKIGNISVDAAGAATVTTYDTLTANSEPYDLVFDSANNAIWFTEKAAGQIGRLDIATATITEFATTPATGMMPTGIAIAPDGSIWFADSAANQIAQFIPSSSAFNQSVIYTPQTPDVTNAGFEDIAMSPNGDHLWVTAPADHKVLQYTFQTDAFSSLAISGPFDPIPGNEREPYNIVAMSTTVVWITDRAQSQIGQLSQGTLANVAWYTLPTAGSAPTGIAVNSSSGGNTIFFTGNATNLAGALPASGNGALIPSEYELSNGSQPSGITLDSSGNVWIAQSGTNKIAVWSSPYFGPTFLPLIEKN